MDLEPATEFTQARSKCNVRSERRSSANLATPFLGMFPKELKSVSQTDATHMLTAAVSVKVQQYVTSIQHGKGKETLAHAVAWVILQGIRLSATNYP